MTTKLEFNATSRPAQLLAIHYAAKVGDAELSRFMAGQSHLSSSESAARIIDGFWRMTDLAIEDEQANLQIEGVADITFWMHKLFNQVHGYMTQNSYHAEWEQAVTARRQWE